MLLRSRLITWPVILLIALLLVACGGNSTGSSPDASSNSPGSSRGTTAEAALAAPSFTVSTGEETSFSLIDHRGDVVVLYFSFPG